MIFTAKEKFLITYNIYHKDKIILTDNFEYDKYKNAWILCLNRKDSIEVPQKKYHYVINQKLFHKILIKKNIKNIIKMEGIKLEDIEIAIVDINSVYKTSFLNKPLSAIKSFFADLFNVFRHIFNDNNSSTLEIEDTWRFRKKVIYGIMLLIIFTIAVIIAFFFMYSLYKLYLYNARIFWVVLMLILHEQLISFAKKVLNYISIKLKSILIKNNK